MLKKFSIILVVVMLFAFTTNVFASDNSSNQIVVSEYDLFKQYEGKTEEELLATGFDKEEAQQLANLTEVVLKQVEELSHYNDNKLKKMGYNNSQINAIHSISNSTKSSVKGMRSDSDILRSSRGLWGSVYMYVNPWCQNSEVRVSYGWYWNGKPFLRMKDVIGFAWDGGLRANSGRVNTWIEYKDGNNAGTKELSRSAITIVPGAGMGHDIQMSSGPAHTTPSWACSGHGTFYLTNPQNVDSFQLVWKYGHSTYDFSGGCMDIKGTPSIAFSSDIETMYQNDESFDIW